jgi:hypothetical protein
MSDSEQKPNSRCGVKRNPGYRFRFRTKLHRARRMTKGPRL